MILSVASDKDCAAIASFESLVGEPLHLFIDIRVIFQGHLLESFLDGLSICSLWDFKLFIERLCRLTDNLGIP